ncbi:MAG: hypothetical protein LBP19_01465 [Treponema sp.]|jgi:hypothetical protein|nr:hypothetical protein [Treponema sp.]
MANTLKSTNLNIREFLKKFVIGLMNISNMVLIIFIFLLTLLIVSSIVIENIIADGYFSNWIINYLLVNKIADGFFSLSFDIIENNYLKLKLFVGLFILLIIIKIILSKIIKRIINGEIWRTIIINFLNIILCCYIAFQSVFLFLCIITAGYINDTSIKANSSTNQINNSSRKITETTREYLLDRKTSADIMLKRIMTKINNGIINIQKLDDEEYISLAKNICIFFEIKETVDTAEEHYLRNYFARGPETLSEMIDTILNNNVVFGWKLLSPNEAVLHQLGKNGEYNLKFVSDDGHFEIIYNKDGKKITQENDPKNMGTFNYADPVLNPRKHSILDVMPYFIWGNTEEDKSYIELIDSNDENYEVHDYYQNSEAVNRYNNIYELLNKEKAGEK